MTPTLPSLAHLTTQPTQVGGDPTLLWAEYRHTIEHAITNQPRSLQVRIGPSELGIDCTWCLGHKLAGIPEQGRDVAWLPWVGSAVHAQLEEVFTHFNGPLPFVRYLVECRVSVGEVDGVDITGSADLLDLVTRVQSDWKVVGKTTLTTTKSKGPSSAYRAQAHLYARGFRRRGIDVDRVQIIYLPRNEPTLANAIVWGEPYQESIALAALARADALAKAIRLAGKDNVLPQLQRAPGCYSCPRYPNADGTAPTAPGHRPGTDLAGLIPQTPDAHRAGSTAA